MGHAQHLLGAADAGHFLGHLLGGPAGHAGVHLVEHHGAHLILLRQDVLHGQHDAGQLAAGGDLVDGAQLLAHVGGHQEPHLVHAVFRQGLLRKADGKPNSAHVQLPQLCEDLLLQPLGRLMPGLGQALRRLTGGLFRLLQLLFQMQQRVPRVLYVVQLPAAAGLVLQHLLHRGAVFLFQAVQLVQPSLHPVQLLGREVEILPLVPDGVRQVVNLAVGGFQPVIQLPQLRVQTPHRGQGPLGLAHQVGGTVAAVVAVEAEIRPGHGGDELLRVVQQGPAALQLLLLAGAQLGPLQLLELIGQGIHPPGLLRLVHFQGLHLPPQGGHGLVFFAILRQQLLRPAKAVQIQQVLLLVQQLLAVVLTVDIQQAAAQGAKLGNGDGASVDPADVLAVAVDLPLQKQLPLPGNAQVLPQPGRNVREARADKGHIGPGTDQVPGGPLAQHGADGVDDDGLTGAGFAGQGVEAGPELDVRALDDGDILNVEQLQHLRIPPMSAPCPASAQHFLDLFREVQGALRVPHDQQGRVVAGQRPHQIRHVHAVHGGAGGVGQARKGLDDHDILGVVHRQDALPEDGAQLVGKVQLGAVGGNGVAVPALPGGLLDQVQFLDVPGNSGLGALDPLGLEPLQQLLLGLDDLLADDLEELVLAVVFHFLEASVPIFLSSISQKLFLESRTSLVVYFEVLTRTWSPFFRENALPPSTER